MADLIEMLFGAVGWVSLRNDVFDGDSDPPWEGAVFGEKWCGAV